MQSRTDSTAFSLPETFMEQVKQARRAAMEAGMRHVSYQVEYLLPDNPHIIGLPFIHYIESDFFSVGEDLRKRIDDLMARSTTLLDEETANQLAKEYAQLGEDMKTHLQRVQNTPEDFILPFKGLTSTQRHEAIAEVPLQKLRNFLQFWEREIDGPLEQVTVSMKKLPESDMSRAFLNASNAAPSAEVQTRVKGLVGIKPKKLIMN
ncbi:MAG TPA: hypothetical protein EYQ41_06560 [Micavibrio sp.]|nr:hypothetical protein [Micavibrio sp.]